MRASRPASAPASGPGSSSTSGGGAVGSSTLMRAMPPPVLAVLVLFVSSLASYAPSLTHVSGTFFVCVARSSTPDGEVEYVAASGFRAPNDLVCDTAGTAYFTDPYHDLG